MFPMMFDTVPAWVAFSVAAMSVVGAADADPTTAAIMAPANIFFELIKSPVIFNVKIRLFVNMMIDTILLERICFHTVPRATLVFPNIDFRLH
jgi:hypothetical protein